MAVPARPLPLDPDPPSLTLVDDPVVPPRAETADCTCPEFCERDHDRD